MTHDRPPGAGSTLAICLAAAFTTLLDQSVLNPALPAIRSSLDAGPATLQWIIAGYSLTFGLALIPAGRLGDTYGRKWLFIAGMSVFCLGSVLGGTATQDWVVAVARLLQGVGAGTVNPQVLGLIQQHFTGRERTRALGAYATVGGIAGVIGPLVGGTLLSGLGGEDGWRWVLLASLPFGLLTIPAAIAWLPQSRPMTARRPDLDLPGIGLLALATICLLLPFVLPAGQGLPRPLWLLAIPPLLALLIVWERRYTGLGRTPILLPALTRSRGFTLGTLVAMFQFGSSLSASLALTLFLQDGLGWTPLHAALVTLPSALGFAVASSLSWRVVSRYGRISVVWALAGSLATLTGTVAVLLWAPGRHLALGLTLTQLLLGITNGLIISPNQALTLAHAPAGAAGLAAGFLQVSQRISATVCTAAVAGLALSAATGVTRTSAAYGLAVCCAMLAFSATFAALDTRQPGPLPFTPPVHQKAR
ncbi:MFS transporter [Winogradskya consettensis]|uniref:MFS transporter n=1 Tax=Winogradskya consettensis TaxID=113560 RepID=A0A919W117_9ACTN|nr:MFS transporter [Actinoplanes consettensis]GIM85197.1 MFS transporter [Actinoplanes consettensis]